MADLTYLEKRKFELLLGMGGGYVLGFTDRTFGEFVADSIGRDIYDERYNYASGSKANRLRGFWRVEENRLAGKLMIDLTEYAALTGKVTKDSEFYDECMAIATRLSQSQPVADLAAVTAASDEKDFETIANAVQSAIDRNEPQAALDRLHTFTTKFLRVRCEVRGVVVTRDKPLHSLVGEYVKQLRAAGHIESDMTLRILKSSISTLEAFNDVRNDQSMAHDNPLLNYDEALLIFNHVAGVIRFVRGLEERIERNEKQLRDARRPVDLDDDVPF